MVGVHGKTVMTGNVLEGHDVCDAFGIIPDTGGISTHKPVMSHRDGPSVAMNMDGLRGELNIMKQIRVGNHVNGGTTVKEDPTVRDRGLPLQPILTA